MGKAPRTIDDLLSARADIDRRISDRIAQAPVVGQIEFGIVPPPVDVSREVDALSSAVAEMQRKLHGEPRAETVAPTTDAEAVQRALRMTTEGERLALIELVELCPGVTDRVGTSGFRGEAQQRRARRYFTHQGAKLRDLVDDAGEGSHQRLAPTPFARRVVLVLKADIERTSMSA